MADSYYELIDQGIDHFVFDLDGGAAINSAGISISIELIEKTKRLGSQLAFCCASKTIAKAFRIMGLLHNSSVDDSRAQAEQVLSL
ncbi:MAG TPA: anti-sigma factor antagonist [Candidatus Handelsmanbacteria bacterium]|nr:anti-sigma factor antagonist [Candidatus Handelsmanbacteria bacterium]